MPVEAFQDTTRFSLSPRVFDLKRVGFLDNSKWNANKLLRHLEAKLAEKFPSATIVRRKKPFFASPATPDLITEIAIDCDVVITAIAD